LSPALHTRMMMSTVERPRKRPRAIALRNWLIDALFRPHWGEVFAGRDLLFPGDFRLKPGEGHVTVNVHYRRYLNLPFIQHDFDHATLLEYFLKITFCHRSGEQGKNYERNGRLSQ